MASQYGDLPTEQPNPASCDLDRMSTEEVLRLINREDAGVAPAVAEVIPQITAAAEAIAECLVRGGRLFYVGAGTSGRLGVLDAAECPPTFGTDPQQIRGIIAGGYGALVRAIEGAEDDEAAGSRAMSRCSVNTRDFVMGVSASGVTPYVRAALQQARARGAKTGLLTCNPSPVTGSMVHYLIAPIVGPEVIAGSTRMKAGTATKLILNMLSTAAMVRLGKVHGNLMVDLTPGCRKLRERYRRALRKLADVGEEEADMLMQSAGNNLKTALLMKLRGLTREQATERLSRSQGFLRKALEEGKSS